LIGLQAVDELIVEMGYVQKQKTLILNRRVSMSFRDSGLVKIFNLMLQS
jgi:hypothetical protein